MISVQCKYRNFAVRGCVASIIALATVMASAEASPHQNLFLAGGNYSPNSQYAYLGSLMPIAGATLGHGLFITPFVSWSRYTFEKNGTQFTGSEPAASIGIGDAWTTKRFSLSISVAGGYSHTSLSPYNPPKSFHGSQWFVEPEVYGKLNLPGGGSATVNGGYLTGLRSYWVSTYLLVPVSSSWSIGPEADFGGGINYQNHTFALRVADKVTPSVSLSLSAGAMTNVPGSYRPYVGVSLGVPFR